MPEVWFTLRWPDNREEKCYSPSSVIADYFSPGTTYPLADFSSRAETALTSASNRVQQKFGYPCSRALGQLSHLKTQIANFQDHDDPVVTCIDMGQ